MRFVDRFAANFMTSLQLANCSVFVPQRRGTLGRRHYTVVYIRMSGRPLSYLHAVHVLMYHELRVTVRGTGRVHRPRRLTVLTSTMLYSTGEIGGRHQAVGAGCTWIH